MIFIIVIAFRFTRRYGVTGDHHSWLTHCDDDGEGGPSIKKHPRVGRQAGLERVHGGLEQWDAQHHHYIPNQQDYVQV